MISFTLRSYAEPAFETLMSAAEILGEYGTTVRYPMGRTEDPDVETAKEAIQLALLAFSKTYFPP